MHTSTFGTIVLFGYIPLCILVYSRLSIVEAAAYCLLGGILFLPPELQFDPPLIPPLHKKTIPLLVGGIALVFAEKPNQITSTKFFGWMIALTVFGTLATVLSNRDPLILAPGLIGQGLGTGDVISILWTQGLGLLVPFAIGRRVFGTPDNALRLMEIWARFGVIYGFLMLLEIRLSPQLNYWVYGYFPSDWIQAIRNGGFRPTVFFSHGLVTTMFCLTAIFATYAVHQCGRTIFGIAAKWWILFLSITLTLSNSLGVLVYLFVFMPLLWMGRVRQVVLLVRLLALLVVLTPALRTAELLPLDELVSWIATHSPDRADSLAFRFDNEAALLERWSLRPWFGYGGYGREKIFSPEGRDLTVMDSEWIIAICQAGVVGFLSKFLLFLTPLWKARKEISKSHHQIEGKKVQLILFVMVGFGLFDLLINSLGNYLLILTAGALFGLTEWIGVQRVASQGPQENQPLGPPGMVR